MTLQPVSLPFRNTGAVALVLAACLATGPAPAQPQTQTPAPARPLVQEKVSFAADVFFDTGSTAVKPAGGIALDKFLASGAAVNVEVVIAVGHADSMESTAPMPLSVNRAEAVKAYLVGKGIDPMRVYTEGKGAQQPAADNKTAEGRAKNRRVELEMVGTRQRP